MARKDRKNRSDDMPSTQAQSAPQSTGDTLSYENFLALYARELQKANIFNPEKNQARKSKAFNPKYSQEKLYEYLKTPTMNEKNLRDASNYMYNVNTRYSRLTQYYAGLPTYAYVISPLNYNGARTKPEALKKQFIKVANKLELMNIKDEVRKQILVALREGVYFGVRWSDSLSSFTQQLDPDMCVITSISDGVFLFSVDMSKIKEDELDHYPPEFTQMYQVYKTGGASSKYQQVPPDISVCIKADPTITEYSLPPFAAVLPLLYVINDTQALQEAADEMDNYKLLAGQVPLDANGVPTLTYQDFVKYYNHIAGNVGDRVGLAVSPFKLSAIDFSKSVAADAVDATARAVSNFWSSCGTSALLHGAENSTAGVSKLAIKSDETFVFAILDQCERQLNRFLKTAVGGSIRFKVSFLRTTVFNLEEMLQKYKEAMNYGIGIFEYMAALGIPQYDIQGLAALQNDVLGVNGLLKPLQTASTQSSDGSGGRPTETDAEIDDAGEVTRDNDSNANR